SRSIVTEHVTPVVGEPQVTGLGIPGETHRVADTPREVLPPAAVRVHAQDGTEAGLVADIAGRAQPDVQLAIRPERNVAPGMEHALGGQAVAHHHRSGWLLQAGLDAIETQDSLWFGHI